MSDGSIVALSQALQTDYQGFQAGSGHRLLSLYAPETVNSIRRMRDQAHARLAASAPPVTQAGRLALYVAETFSRG